MNNNITLQEPVWPPNYTLYLDHDLIQTLQLESQNKQAPEAYKLFLSRLIKYTQDKENELENNEVLLKKLEEINEKISVFVQIAQENYENLVKIYKDEHSYYLDLQDSQNKPHLQHEPRIIYQEQATAELKQCLHVITKEKEELEREFEAYKKEAFQKSEKQGIQRRDLENVLYAKDTQVEMLEKKTCELRKLVKQVEEKRLKHTTAAAMLQITYMQKNMQNKA